MRNEDDSRRNMPGPSVTPEVDNDLYKNYSRQHRKRQKNVLTNTWMTAAVSRRKPLNIAKREPKPDYFGLDNSMKQLTLQKPRKWRTKERDGGSNFQAISDKKTRVVENQNEVEDKFSITSEDRHITRRARSSAYAKFKYPEKFHYRVKSHSLHLEEQIPRCLKQFSRYCNQPLRQDCKYNPLRSVTQLNVHSVKSCGLPHPNPDGSKAKRRRPMSAPPGTMTSYSLNSSFNRSNSLFGNGSSGLRQRPQSAVPTRNVVVEDLARNGTYSFSYDDDLEEEGPSHVTLEVIDSDDDDDVAKNDITELGNSDHEDSLHSAARSNYSQNTEGFVKNSEITKVGSSESAAEEVASDDGQNESDNYVYSDNESESAKSVASDSD